MATNSARTVPETDSLALVDLYNSTNGATWKDNTNWLTGQVTSWSGVTIADGRVTRIELNSNNLSGSLPASLGDLAALQYLHLNHNQLSGSMPGELGNLSSLRMLELYNNQLSGSIPSELGNLSSLHSLDLKLNQLSGSIPISLGKLSKLQDLNLQGNQLSGSIPSELGNLSSLRTFDLFNNQLSGSIPTSLGNLSSLHTLYLGKNQLSGSIPSSLGNASLLRHLNLQFNQLIGSIPSSLGSLSSLGNLYLNNNQLSSSVPSGLGNLPYLINVDLSNNQFSGTAPSLSVLSGKLYPLRGLKLNNNQFTSLPLFTGNDNYSTLQVDSNRLTFESLEINLDYFSYYAQYTPQDSVGLAAKKSVNPGQSLTLSALVSGKNNQYQWTKDGADIPDAKSAELVLSNLTKAQQGWYSCKITNTVVTGLTLERRRVWVEVITPSNTAPTITSISNQISCPDQIAGAHYSISDAETVATSLQVSATSSNSAILPTENIALGGTGNNRTILLTPLGLSGTTTITISVTDEAGATASTTFNLTFKDAPTINVGPNQTVCANEEAIVLTPGTIWHMAYWSGPGVDSNRGIFTPSASLVGVQTLTYTVTSNGCTVTATKTITVKEVPTAPTASADTPTARGTLHLNASTVANATYQWTGPNGFSSTQQNPTIANVTAAHAGAYSLTVSNGSCSSNASTVQVTIKPISTISVTLSLDSVSGAANAEVVVPVRVSDFKSILSIQGSINWNASVASLVGVEAYGLPDLTDSNFGLTQASSGQLSFSWIDAHLQAQSLANNTILFSLRFKLVGSSGSAITLTLGNTPIPVEIVDQNSTALTANLKAGAITILSTVALSGKVSTSTGKAVKGVTLKAMGNGSTQNATTATDGSYQFNLNSGTNYSLQASKSPDSQSSNGITTLDLLLIQRHILQVAPLNSPYKIIAADVNGSGSISTLDLVLIRSLILADRSSFPGERLWRFIRSDYIFSNPANPFPYDSLRTFNSMDASKGFDFIGVKLGDVNNSWDPAVARITTSGEVSFLLENQQALPGTEIVVPVKVADFQQISGYQFTLTWNPKVLQYQGVVNEALTGSFGISQVGNGKLSTSWNDVKGTSQTLADHQTAFQVRFKVIGALGSESPVSINSSVTTSIAYSQEMKALTVESIPKVVKVSHKEVGHALYQNQPNPFQASTTIRFSIPQKQAVTITIYNALGQVIKTLQREFEAGEQQMEWNGQSESGQKSNTGTYFYQMKAANFVEVKKLLIE